ncbi:hypothetical protein [Cytobacillus gottheilii]|uniref:Uncharacterized protein n=1 Tax=Cytobacillus gottheilii TaxID=859144 RepID=A0ABX8FER9_9BACI|nr:hypothetical protein [Cytobacillus gottheilii]QVY62495.1 hypothetical protein J1899_05315 [Cytobacillus gottheilii]
MEKTRKKSPKKFFAIAGILGAIILTLYAVEQVFHVDAGLTAFLDLLDSLSWRT